VEFELQPTLTGTRIVLRPLEPGDYDAVYAAARDPRIWEQHPEPDRHTPAVFRRYFDGAIESGGAFAIVERASGRIIGSSRYCHLDPAGREVEIGWTFLERAHWGGAVNGELKSLMLDHAFRFVDRVVFVIGAGNLRSRRAVEKIGAHLVREGTSLDRDGRPVDKVVYAIERTSREASRA
jgi:N-acetyltransferase